MKNIKQRQEEKNGWGCGGKIHSSFNFFAK